MLESSPKLKGKNKLGQVPSVKKTDDPFKSSNEIKRTFYVKNAENTNILEYMNDYNPQRSSQENKYSYQGISRKLS